MKCQTKIGKPGKTTSREDRKIVSITKGTFKTTWAISRELCESFYKSKETVSRRLEVSGFRAHVAEYKHIIGRRNMRKC